MEFDYFRRFIHWQCWVVSSGPQVRVSLCRIGLCRVTRLTRVLASNLSSTQYSQIHTYIHIFITRNTVKQSLNQRRGQSLAGSDVVFPEKYYVENFPQRKNICSLF